MTQVKVVPDATPDSKVGKERQVSGYNVPYFDLSDSIDVARIVRENGGRVNREQLVGLLKYKSAASGTFKTRVSAAKAFGVIEQPEPNSDVIAISARGTAIVAPVSDAHAMQAKIDAFMDIPLFKLLYDDNKGRELPADIGLANLFENTHKMLKSRAMPAVKVMMASAATAGLFTINGVSSRKMVMPILPNGGGTAKEDARIKNPPRDEHNQNGGGSGGGGGGSSGSGGGFSGEGLHPAIYGLLKDLPKVGSVVSKKKREALIAAFTATVNFIYPDEE